MRVDSLFSKIKIKIKKKGVFFCMVSFFYKSVSFLRGWIYTKLLGTKFIFEIGISPKIRGKHNIYIGKRCRFGSFFWLEAVDDYYGQNLNPNINIGDDVVINDFVHIAAVNSVKIGDGCLIASKVLITDHSHGVYDGSDQSCPTEPPVFRKLSSKKGIVIGKNVWLGESVSVLQGAIIGDGVIVGANSIVVGELPANTICVGSPAKPVKCFSFETNTWNLI